MKSRLVVLSMLVFGMLLSTTGAGLAVTGLASNNASVAQYGPTGGGGGGGGGVLGDEDTGAGEQPSDNGGGSSPGGDEGSGVQPSRQIEAAADTGSSLPFTGFAAVPILLGGLVLLSAGLVLRRRSGTDS